MPGFQAQRVPGAQAGRHEPVRRAGLQQRVPHAGRGVPVDEQLEAVLAGVAGARDPGVRAGDVALRDGVVLQRAPRSTSVSGARMAARVGPWIAMSDVRSEASSKGRPEGGRGAPRSGGHGRRVRGVGHHQEALLRDAVDDQVVDDAAVLGARSSSSGRGRRHESRRIAHQGVGQAPRRRRGRSTQSSPMCDRSKRPALRRTARCSSMMPVYWTGISQPAKSMRRAPSARWVS